LGDPGDVRTELGPLANAVQYERVTSLITAAIGSGARLVCGGVERPEGLPRGFFIKPTILCDVTPTMAIAREEVFGPVLAVMIYRDVAQAVEIANDTIYGLCGYVLGPPVEASAVARRLEAGFIMVNRAEGSLEMPFGGYKQSGNRREMGGHIGLEEFLEVKAIAEDLA